MPRGNVFSWNKTNQQKLKNIVKSFNKKLSTLKKENPSISSSLPSKATMKTLKEAITNENDFNKNIERLKNFLKPNAEKLVKVKETRDNIKITKWQYDEIKQLAKDVNKARKERRDYLNSRDLKVGGKPLNYKRGQIGMGSALENELKPTTAFSSSMLNYDVKRKYKSLLVQSGEDYFRKRDYLLRRNYIKTLKEEYGNDSKPIINKIYRLSIDEFLKIFYEEDHPFEFIYKTENYSLYLNTMRSTWGLKSNEDSDTIKYNEIKSKKKK